MSQPWDCQPGETGKDYARFLSFLAIAPQQRSWAAVARTEGISPSTARATGTKWDWRERAEQHDRHVLPVVAAEVTASRTARHRQDLETFRVDQQRLARRQERLGALLSGAVARSVLAMARRGEEIPAQSLASVAAAGLRLQEAGTETRGLLMGLDQLMEALVPEDDGLDDAHLLEPGD